MFREENHKGIVSYLMNRLFSAVIFVTLFFLKTESFAQFAPAASQLGTTAIYKDSSAFVSWANSGIVFRGLQDISLPLNDYANVGDSASAFGMAGTNGVVSLGDGGYAILQFTSPIVNEFGPDFAVFENSFDDSFLELAIVEVSSDGIHFYRFPATSKTDTLIQTWSFGLTDATKINNLAGKYRGDYGTPFDLDDITDDALLNKQAITHVKIIDVVGCIQNDYCTRDYYNRKINDPWPTPFGSGGFDLDAVGVLHQQTVGINEVDLFQIRVFPNPATDVLNILTGLNDNCSVSISNLIGEKVVQIDDKCNSLSVPINQLTQGVYYLTIINRGKEKKVKFVKL